MSAIGRRMNHLKSLMEVHNGPGAAILPPNVTRLHLEFAHKWNGGHMGPRKFWRENLPRLKYHNPAVPMVVNRTRTQDGPATLSIYIRDDSAAPPLLDVPAAAPAEAPPTTTTSSSGAEGAAAGGAGGEAAAAAAAAVDAEGEKGEAEAAKSTAESAAAPAIQPPEKALAVADPWAHIASSTDGRATAPPPARGERVVALDLKLTNSEDIWLKVLAATGARELMPTEEDQAEMERLARLQEQAVKDRAEQKAYRDKIKAEKQMLERARKEADALKAE